MNGPGEPAAGAPRRAHGSFQAQIDTVESTQRLRRPATSRSARSPPPPHRRPDPGAASARSADANTPAGTDQTTPGSATGASDTTTSGQVIRWRLAPRRDRIHRREPAGAGCPLETARQLTGIPDTRLVERLLATGGLSVADGRIHAPGPGAGLRRRPPFGSEWQWAGKSSSSPVKWG